MMSFFVLAVGDPVGHAIDHPFYEINGWWIWSSNVGNLLLTGLIMLTLGPWIASKIATGHESEGNDRYLTRNPLAHMVEVVCVYLRENTVRPMLGARTETFMPFLWTLFFFVLINNLLGLIPIIDILHLVNHGWEESHRAPFGGTATQSIFVTGVLALISFIVINVSGLRQLGVGGYLKHLTAGTSPALWPLMVPIELMSTFIKPVALAIRLFANMTAGHILTATLFIFAGQGIAMIFGSRVLLGGVVTVPSVLFAFCISFLELLVAFLQAFVFMFLTTVFISQLAHHDDEHAHDHEHAPAH